MTSYEKLVNKIHEEQDNYLAEIEKLPPKKIIFKAYEICYREEFVNILENTEFSEELTQALSDLPNPIGYLYDLWLGVDSSAWDMLEDMIRDCEIRLIERSSIW